ncbi:MAG TPA: hypothetical protein VFS71_10790 [Flavobacterium sp.]|uniref:hypothetical protein n=1 Tax=Flavobacterium sp. TaxID=239 RepID=UPI002DBEA9A0|nr:hypothetical protein [Flavobacterium sp.]HEU4790164.1 hypothetical protein [Flavobacterium sp.]
MKIITVDTPLHQRRTVFIADVSTLAKYDNTKKIKFTTPYKILKIPLDFTALVMPIAISVVDVGIDLLEKLRLKKFENIAKGEIDYCAENFNFPAQHPANGVMYACPDYQSDFYIPIANFHDYTFQLKMSAFVEMCASLGAKKCSVIYAEENGKEISLNVKGNGPTTSGDVSFENKTKYKYTNETSFNSEYDFPKPKEINEFVSKWVKTEPSWSTIQRIRINNGITKSRVEINYSDEMGIDTQFSTKLTKMGVNIGGTFNQIKKRKYVYEVEFWEID